MPYNNKRCFSEVLIPIRKEYFKLALLRVTLLSFKTSQDFFRSFVDKEPIEGFGHSSSWTTIWHFLGPPFGHSGRKSPGQTGRRECGGKLILAMPILFPATEDISFQLKTFDEQFNVQVYAILWIS